MQRTYDIRVAALTTRVPLKWLDNLLSQAILPGIERSRQGVERRISETGLLAIELVRVLTWELGLPIRQAARIASLAVATRAGSLARVELPSGVALLFPLAELEMLLRERIIDAVEAAGRVRRGRPPRPSGNDVAPDDHSPGA